MTSKFAQTSEFNKLLVDSGSTNREKSLAALHEFAKALELPLRKGVLSGDILDCRGTGLLRQTDGTAR